jgi:hypothetical protein
MPDAIPTNVTAERFDRYAARGLADEAPDRKEDLRLAAQHLIWALGHLRDAGAKAVDMAELARVGHDCISNRDGQLDRDLDAAGCWFDPVDLTELDALT